MSAIKKASDFLRDVRVEMSKVTWPSREELTQSTLVVIFLVFLFTLFVGAVDRVIALLVEQLIMKM